MGRNLLNANEEKQVLDILIPKLENYKAKTTFKITLNGHSLTFKGRTHWKSSTAAKLAYNYWIKYQLYHVLNVKNGYVFLGKPITVDEYFWLKKEISSLLFSKLKIEECPPV